MTTHRPVIVFRYDYFKTSLISAPVPLLDYQFHDNLLCHTAASCLAGTVATSEFPSQGWLLGANAITQLFVHQPMSLSLASCLLYGLSYYSVA